MKLPALKLVPAELFSKFPLSTLDVNRTSLR